MSSRHGKNNIMVADGMEPAVTTSSQRLDEIAGILAGALLRLRAKHAGGRKERVLPGQSP